ncbi:hypothetical protein H5410_018129 [Solanum commersonii]|uniref:DUF1985 domain-containing protein n=1 Tax=Solanum commersonii TaxID=4109 RepID=A0A9J6A181_SOLCO|nr:hypothetical protein H5410_018129 [Solanum commersonii]
MNDEIVVKKKKGWRNPPKKERKVTYAVSRPTLPKVQHDNKDVLHVRHANGTVLQFGIKKFAIDTTQDAVQMTILYFINTFILCHLGETSIKIEEFLMVKDGTYELYPWGKIAFDKLITSLRQDFNQSKQMYRLFGMPYALNVWTYECASSINPEIVVKVANNACSNIVPTQDEVEALDLPNIQDAHTPEPSTTAVLPNKVQTRAFT